MFWYIIPSIQRLSVNLGYDWWFIRINIKTLCFFLKHTMPNCYANGFFSDWLEACKSLSTMAGVLPDKELDGSPASRKPRKTSVSRYVPYWYATIGDIKSFKKFRNET